MKAFDNVNLYFISYYSAALVLGILLEVTQTLLFKYSNGRIEKIKYLGQTACAFIFLGLTVGIFTGGSREPAVQFLLPIIPTIYGGLVAYVFYKSSDDNPLNRQIALTSLIFISLGLIVGGEVSAHYRLLSEANDLEVQEYYKEKFESFKSDIKVYELGKQAEFDLYVKQKSNETDSSSH